MHLWVAPSKEKKKSQIYSSNLIIVIDTCLVSFTEEKMCLFTQQTGASACGRTILSHTTSSCCWSQVRHLIENTRSIWSPTQESRTTHKYMSLQMWLHLGEINQLSNSIGFNTKKQQINQPNRNSFTYYAYN